MRIANSMKRVCGAGTWQAGISYNDDFPAQGPGAQLNSWYDQEGKRKAFSGVGRGHGGRLSSGCCHHCSPFFHPALVSRDNCSIRLGERTGDWDGE